MSPRWRKVLKDLWGNKTRTLLAVMAIAAGVFAVGAISTAYFAISHDIDPSYAAIHPAHGEIVAEPFDDALVKAIERLPGVEEAEGRVVLGNMSILLGPDKKRPLTLMAAEDLSALRLDHLRLLSGSWPGKLEMVILPDQFTRTPSQFAQTGDRVQVELPDGRIRALRVSGMAQDLNNGSSDLAVYAYVNLQTLDALGLPRAFNRLYFRASSATPTEADVRAAARAIESRFTHSDIAVFQSLVRPPNQHPMHAAAVGLLGVMAFVGLLLLAMGGFLVSNIISMLLAQQVRQIGIMKAIGARPDQVTGMYIMLATSFGAVALVIALPSAPLAGYALAQIMVSLLSFNLQGFRVFPASLLLMLVMGLLVPWLATLLPVHNVLRISTHTAIATYGTSAEVSSHWIDRLVERFRGLSRPGLISLRNVLRRKGRLGLTLAALALAGAAFMSVFTTRASVILSFDQLLPLCFADLNLDFDRAYRAEAILQTVQSLPGVVHVEAWATTTAELLDAEGHTIVDRFNIVAPPLNSRFITHPPIIEGRWLSAGDQNALVINMQISHDHPELRVGDTLRLRVNGRNASFVIVGKFTWVEGDSMAYASYARISQLLGEAGRARTYRVMAESSVPAFQDLVGARVFGALKERGYTPVITTGAAGRNIVAAGADGVAAGIMILALLAVAVGGIGLTSTMSMNVLERTREIGVMRAIGATNGAIRQMVVLEGVLVGVLSWLIALGLSFPLSHLLCAGVGMALLKRPLDYVFAWESVVIWLALVIVISALASLGPALNAARLTVRDALTYE